MRSMLHHSFTLLQITKLSCRNINFNEFEKAFVAITGFAELNESELKSI